jgi:tRNA threonylcarbamoyladenosine biosynthesis protein TsaB
MGLILNIDTATQTAQVSFAKDGKVLQSLTNELQKDHASFLQTAIQQLAKNISIALADVDAIAVTAGPGSYTGIRVGMASAKGLCYALSKPLIAINTLKVLTVAAQQELNNAPEILFCPMIDARRMEVFTAIYNNTLAEILPPCAIILEERSFLPQLQNNKIVFFGSGAAKWQTLCSHSNASFAAASNILCNKNSAILPTASHFI